MKPRLLLARLWGLVGGRRLGRELDDEIAFHLAQEARLYQARGLSEDEAYQAARRRFGNLTATRERHRETGGMPAIDVLLQDFAHGVRILARQPGFTLVAVLSLAFGIGVNTTVFTLVDASLLATLPYSAPDRLVRLSAVPASAPDARDSASVLEYQTWRDGNRSFAAVGSMIGGVFPRNVGTGQDGVPPERITTQGFSAGMWQVLGVEPLLGRVFTADEDRVGMPPGVIVLSHEYWQRRFGGDPDVLGRTITLMNEPVTVIGVMPPGFGREFYGPISAWTPIGFTPTNVESIVRYLTVVARLRPGVTVEQAQAEMNGLAAGFAERYPERNRDWGVAVDRLQASLVGDLRRPLLVLQGAVGLVLLIACANVAGMLLARGASRQSEVALRHALGAGRLRIAGQLLMESVPLAILGGVVGVGVAWLGLHFVFVVIPPIPALDDASLDASVLIFTSGVALLSVVVFGTMPAVQGSRPDPSRVLNESGRTRTDDGRRQRLRAVLVAGQIALAFVLLAGAGLLINSFARLQANELGVDASGLATFDYQFSVEESMTPVGQYRDVGLWEVSPEVERSFERVYERLKQVPGVLAVAGANRPPLRDGALEMEVRIDGSDRVADTGSTPPISAFYYGVTPGYFDTLRIPVLEGRAFDETDRATTRPVAIVNQAMADAYWPGENPIGRTLRLTFVPEEPSREIVGVVGNTRVSRFDTQPPRILYVPYLQHTRQWQGPAWWDRMRMAYVVRTAGDPMRLAQAVRRAVAEVDAIHPAADFRTVEGDLGAETQGLRAQMILFGAFGGLALVLASVGIYGVIAYSVAQRTREIGIRMALGAPAGGVLGLVAGQALGIVLVGQGVGLATALALTRVLASTLWGVSATDPVTFASAGVVLFGAALCACLVPARRAIKIDPTVALRTG